MTSIVIRLRERAASIALAARARPERYQSKTALLCLEAADMIDLLKGDTDQLHDICDRNEAEIARLEEALTRIARGFCTAEGMKAIADEALGEK